MEKIRKNTIIKQFFVIVASSLLMAININTFVSTGGLVPGGATGLALLIQRSFAKFAKVAIPYTPLNLAINAIPIYIGFRFIGKKFTGSSLFVIALSSVLTDFLPKYVITYDTLLISIFGGIINGVAISLCLRNDTTTGGTDFISIFISQRTGRDSFNVILGINVVILLVSGLLFGWDKALYSIIFQFATTQVEHIMYRNYQQVTLLIITKIPDAVCAMIYAETDHGGTIVDGLGSHEKNKRKIVYSVIGAAEEARVIKKVKEIDPAAFCNVIRTEKIAGKFFLQPHD
ncbi:MAG: YitT family protein [Lachnospiraceae bacterium]|uniref:YitT family protein n=1 Tax=Candidatus Weimeria bifida TaxID=2599074 RepID=A0A6N7J2B0_9FIRM|nr:YitT family protein [Candidatus Weimeria bifida]RRF97437.1 MAG: YitT family protein [Lachnospiraceae bacterium]